MTRRFKIWLVVAVLFTLLNLAGGVVAAMQGEILHAGAHAGLMLLGAFAVWLLVPKRHALRIGRRGASVSPASARELSDRLTNIEQAVDAMAIEVERIGEGQRFLTHLFTERDIVRMAAGGAAETSPEIRAPDAAADERQ